MPEPIAQNGKWQTRKPCISLRDKQIQIDHLRFKYDYQVVNRFSSWKNKEGEGLWCDNINNTVEGREKFSGTNIQTFVSSLQKEQSRQQWLTRKLRKVQSMRKQTRLSCRCNQQGRILMNLYFFFYTAFFPTPSVKDKH